MGLENILSVTGKPGLFKLKSRARNGFVVESLLDHKTSIIGINQNVSILKDISIYTYDTEVPLKEVFASIGTKESNGKTAINHKVANAELANYFGDVLPNYDQERVYPSDIKKVIQWYNLLQENDLLLEIAADELDESKASGEEE